MSMVFFNTGWMKSYDGLNEADSKIVGGGSYIADNGYGYEIYNFRKVNGRVYGYVQPSGLQNNLQRLGAPEDAESISGVTVVWTASNPSGGVYIVGWYKNATVFRDYQEAKQIPQRKYKRNYLGYYAVASDKDVRLLGFDERTFAIPTGVKGGKGRSNVWYADDPIMVEFRKSVQNYINTFENSEKVIRKNRNVLPRQSNSILRQKVERRAVVAVTNYYESLGYKVVSLEKDNVGWDLEVSLGKINLKVEVKGLSGNIVSTEITPNEYIQMKKHKDIYRIAIVTDCLHSPQLNIFSYSPEKFVWENSHGVTLNISEFMGAKIFI